MTKKQKFAHLEVISCLVNTNLVLVIEATGKPVDALITHHDQPIPGEFKLRAPPKKS